MALEGDVTALRLCMERIYPTQTQAAQELQEQLDALKDRLEELVTRRAA